MCATMRRSTATTDGIARLLQADLGSQAAMLCRSLSEDVVVLHWLVLHEDDPAWLVDRFFDHEAALAASRHRRGGEHAWPGPEAGRPPSELAELVDRIRKPSREGGYGERATTDWWAFDAHGAALDYVDVVKRLNLAERYANRFRDANPDLLAHHRIAERWANMHLHHTSSGLNPVPRGEGLPGPESYPPEYVSHHAAQLAYWAYVCQVALTIEFRSLPLIAEYEQLLQDARRAFKGSWSRLQAEAESQ
ncbi:MAG TPA: DUF5677 domain-containing protein [Solirubrobacteraceae bacterium]|nr:DUF5677 domain-containing protein [Solirubrobacteraceae bacterium]